MQCLEEVHELRGHDVNNMGNGVPLLAVSTYCAALNALAACCSVGMKNGTRPRWGIMPGDEIPLRDISPVKVPKADADYLKSLKSQAMEWDEELEAEIKKGKKQRVKFRGEPIYLFLLVRIRVRRWRLFVFDFCMSNVFMYCFYVHAFIHFFFVVRFFVCFFYTFFACTLSCTLSSTYLCSH